MNLGSTGLAKGLKPIRLWYRIAYLVDLVPSRVAAFPQYPLRDGSRARLMHCMADRALPSARSRRWRRLRVEFGRADVKSPLRPGSHWEPASMNIRRACRESKRLSQSRDGSLLPLLLRACHLITCYPRAKAEWMQLSRSAFRNGLLRKQIAPALKA